MTLDVRSNEGNLCHRAHTVTNRIADDAVDCGEDGWEFNVLCQWTCVATTTTTTTTTTTSTSTTTTEVTCQVAWPQGATGPLTDGAPVSVGTSFT